MEEGADKSQVHEVAVNTENLAEGRGHESVVA